MKLYKEIFEHYAPKDSESGIKRYFVAKNDEEAFVVVFNDYCQYIETEVEEWDTYGADGGDERTEDEVRTEARKKVIEACGHISLNENWDDLYYGLTLKGWEYVSEICRAQEGILIELNILEKENYESK